MVMLRQREVLKIPYTKNYIEPAEEKGAKPVLLTPIVRHEFDENGKVIDAHGHYDDAIRELAKETNVLALM